jgi:hypothetical protein
MSNTAACRCKLRIDHTTRDESPTRIPCVFCREKRGHWSSQNTVPARLAGMTLRPELPEHAGRHIEAFEQQRTTNEMMKQFDPTVWFTDSTGVSQLAGL